MYLVTISLWLRCNSCRVVHAQNFWGLQGSLLREAGGGGACVFGSVISKAKAANKMWVSIEKIIKGGKYIVQN